MFRRIKERVARRDGRGQMATIAVVLLIAVVAIGSTSVVVFGSDALDIAERAMRAGSAQNAMMQFDAAASLVAYGTADSRTVGLPSTSTSTVTVDGDRGWMNVTIVNETRDSVDTVVMNVSLGAVVYENGETTITYQAGGVWRNESGGGTVMVSAPDFQYRASGGTDATLTLPMVTVRGNGSVGDSPRITQADTVSKKYPSGSEPNPLPDGGGEVNITVHSEYYRTWGEFFERQVSDAVTYDHSEETVTATLFVSGASGNEVSGAVSGAASGATLTVDNDIKVDKYNSSEGPYASSKGSGGKIKLAGDIVMASGATITGDVALGGTLDVSAGGGGGGGGGNPGGGGGGGGGNPVITGDLFCVNAGCEGDDGDIVNQKIYNNGTVPEVSTADKLIDEKVSEAQSNNNNSHPEAPISSNTIDTGECPCELYGGEGKDGRYYLDNFDISDVDITLNTNPGDITIAVDGTFEYGDNTGGTDTMEVVGPGTVKIYVNDKSITVGKDEQIKNGDMVADQFWLYGPAGSTVNVNQNANVTGVIYAPSAPGETTEVKLKQNAKLHGGVVAHVSQVTGGGGRVSYDTALSGTDPFAASNKSPISYLHVSVGRVNVTG